MHYSFECYRNGCQGGEFKINGIVTYGAGEPQVGAIYIDSGNEHESYLSPCPKCKKLAYGVRDIDLSPLLQVSPSALTDNKIWMKEAINEIVVQLRKINKRLDSLEG